VLEASGFVLSAAILGGVGTFFATVIALARKKLYVWEDPRIDAVTSSFPSELWRLRKAGVAPRWK
jgi:Na+-translocating ferredoxin:NAD+ oxidoreductase RNF subunit RnfB